MSKIDIIEVLLYFALLIIVGVIGSKRAKTSEDYALAGRNLGFFMYLGCLAAVILGGASTIGTASLGYKFGISGAWFVFSIGLGIAVLGLFFITKISKYKVLTISELLGKRYNERARLISGVVAAIYTLMVSVTQVIGIGTIFNVLLGWDLKITMVLGGGIVVFYTILGGMWSVTVTDIIQFVVKTTGVFFIMLPISLSHAGGWKALTATLPANYFDLSNMGYDKIFQYFMLYTLGMVVSQDIWQRIFTAKTAKISKWGAIFAGAYSVAYAVALSIIGMCGVILLPNLADPQNVFAHMAISILPHGVLGIILAAVCSALMSTSSGTLLASSTIITNDLLKQHVLKNISDKQLVFVSRVTTLTVGLLAIVFALWIQNILVALDVAYAILSGAIFVPTVMGFFWKRATAKAGFYSIIVSTIVVLGGLAVEGLSATNPILYGIAAGVVVMCVTTLLFSKNETSLIMHSQEEEQILS
ncbi:sodium:solute symporter [Ectobacillus panaciterrae]|uniref:sodium:solute symporter n=1 Tax=Ectobacillus panaciterrae TaxID=363872 RepID=UPI00042A776F|nr:sodium:solute symporter [Ectobacillus panaciterrae]